MNQKAPEGQQPFWADEPDFSSPRLVPPIRLLYWLVQLIGLFMVLTIVFIPTYVLFLLAPAPWGWLWLILIGAIFLLSFLGSWLRHRRVPKFAEIQERARSLTQATHIGSALHVAGHPLLARDQPIVLSLKRETLALFTYNNEIPVDILQLDQLKSVQTVTYDDDRVPHVDVIDGTAQALQITFQRDHESWTCLFRQMRKIRAIDWYHAIQQARFKASHPGQNPS